MAELEKRFKREFLRAPLTTTLLYEDGGAVLKATIKNISEGGLLVAGLPKLPEINLLPLMIDLPQYPDLISLGAARAKNLSLDQIDRKILRVRGAMIRDFKEADPSLEVLVANIGCRFVEPRPEVIEAIRDYVTLFARNIVFLLNLFEASSSKEKNQELIRHASQLLGYNLNDPFPLLRQKVMHDYQSLESL